MNPMRRLLLALTLLPVLAHAQAYPDKSKPIRMILPFGAGTSTDVLGRALARGMTEVAGLNVIVDNKPGGEAVIGAQAAKLSPPDGYTMFLTTISTQALNPHMLANLPYEPLTDFVPLVGVAKTTLMVNMGPSTPFKTAREFFAAAKASPGKYTAGTGSAFTRLTAEVFQRAAGIEMLVVPHKNLTDAMMGVAAGQLDMVIVDSATAGPFYKNNVRAVATTGSARASAYPNVPTLREEGLADFELVGWFAAYFPAKTPPAVATAMRDILRAALKTKTVAEVYTTFGMEPLDLAGEQLEAFQRAEHERWGKAVRAANMGPAK